MEMAEKCVKVMEPAGVVVVAGGEVRRTNSSNLRDLLRIDVERTSSAILLDFLRIKQEDSCRKDIGSSGGGDGGGSGGGGGNTSNRQTLGAVLSLTKNSISSERSILDAISDVPSGSGSGVSIRDSKKNWRDIRKRLKLRRGGSSPIPAPDVAVSPISHRLSLSELLQRTASQAVDRGSNRVYNSVGNGEEGVVSEGGGESSGGAEEPVRISLMALLAETDSAYIINGNKVEEGEDDGDEEAGKLLEYNACCVCMVRHKGAAFIPCGHTFCRLCSRELYVQRGNCPVCNSLILEILDIF